MLAPSSFLLLLKLFNFTSLFIQIANMSAEEDQALAMLKRVNLSLRKAILANFPCAYEQYVCLSLPGTVIDTTEGGRYVILHFRTKGHANNTYCSATSPHPLESRLISAMPSTATKLCWRIA